MYRKEKIKCKNENQKITTYDTISLKANNIILIRNERNEHYKTQHEAEKPIKKINRLKFNYLIHICSQQTAPKDKTEE